MKKSLKHITVLFLAVGLLVGVFYWWQTIQKQPTSQNSSIVKNDQASKPQVGFELTNINAISTNPARMAKSRANLSKVAADLGLKMQCKQDKMSDAMSDKLFNLNIDLRHEQLNYGVMAKSDCMIARQEDEAGCSSSKEPADCYYSPQLERDWQTWLDGYRKLGYQISDQRTSTAIATGRGSTCLIARAPERTIRWRLPVLILII